MNTVEIELTEEQQAAVDTLVSLRKEIQSLGGYAGTGKTTVISSLKERLPKFAVCAYTGKATQVLRKKNITASTIHSKIYHPVENELTHEVDWELIPRLEVSFEGFIVDEASMIGRALYNDLRSFRLPIIFVGDHGQLEPVKGDGFNLMTSPDITLEKIHRNAGKIARFAEHLRKGNSAADWEDEFELSSMSVGEDTKLVDAGEVILLSQDELINFATASEEDQIICAFNKTRCAINQAVREHLGFPADIPVEGDRIICLQNSRDHGVFNGMQGKIHSIDHAKRRLVFQADDRFYPVPYVPEAFNSERTPERSKDGSIPFDYAYCVTCHKMQGSEADNVTVIEQRCPAWSHQRWAYTAASRAKRQLVWVCG